MSDIGDRLHNVLRRIERAAEGAHRDPSDVVLVAVGKTQPASRVAEAVVAGVTDVGENRVQEAAEKKPSVDGARWHMIGPLQRNKVGTALELFDVVHTVDRPKLVDRLERLLERDQPERRLPVLLEINLARESQKAGVLPEDADALARLALDAPHLELTGLMAIPPLENDPEASRPHFRSLRRLRDELQDALGGPLPELSCGMSHDYEIAVEEGATLLRVGTAIYGPRRTP